MTPTIQHAEETSGTQFQFADRIHKVVYELSEPNLLLSALKTVEKRIQDLPKDLYECSRKENEPLKVG